MKKQNLFMISFAVIVVFVVAFIGMSQFAIYNDTYCNKVSTNAAVLSNDKAMCEKNGYDCTVSGTRLACKSTSIANCKNGLISSTCRCFNMQTNLLVENRPTGTAGWYSCDGVCGDAAYYKNSKCNNCVNTCTVSKCENNKFYGCASGCYEPSISCQYGYCENSRECGKTKLSAEPVYAGQLKDVTVSKSEIYTGDEIIVKGKFVAQGTALYTFMVETSYINPTLTVYGTGTNEVLKDKLVNSGNTEPFEFKLTDTTKTGTYTISVNILSPTDIVATQQINVKVLPREELDKCQNVNCDDSNDCTADSCVAGVCINEAITDCVDSGEVTGTDTGSVNFVEQNFFMQYLWWIVGGVFGTLILVLIVILMKKKR